MGVSCWCSGVAFVVTDMRVVDAEETVDTYRYYFFPPDPAPAIWRAFECENDQQAHEYALGLSVGYPQVEKIEVWHDTKLTSTYARSLVRTPEELRRLCYLSIAASTKEPYQALKMELAGQAFKLAQEAAALERQIKKES